MSVYEKKLLIVWCTFTAVMVMALIPVIIWAIRSGQFSNNATAKYLPLKSGIPEKDKESKNVSP